MYARDRASMRMASWSSAFVSVMGGYELSFSRSGLDFLGAAAVKWISGIFAGLRGLVSFFWTLLGPTVLFAWRFLDCNRSVYVCASP